MIAFRLADRSDLAQVLELLREIMAHHGVASPPDPELAACVGSIIDSPDHLFLLARKGGRTVGMCALLFSMSTWSAAPVCEVQDLIVTEQSRGNDVGRGLLDEASRIARERGCTRLFLLAEYWNLDAHAFYRQVGLAEQTCLDFERDLRGDLP